MITATTGVGKTTLAGCVILAALGIGPRTALGLPVAPAERVLYLAMDRPRQIARSFRRSVRETDRAALEGRLVIWQGPSRRHREDAEYAPRARTGGEGRRPGHRQPQGRRHRLERRHRGRRVNNALQQVLQAGIDIIVLHHQTKRSGDGTGAGRSRWRTSTGRRGSPPALGPSSCCTVRPGPRPPS
ncbi:hypothetical protein NKG05_26105 [Oerskovia sp. M15]